MTKKISVEQVEAEVLSTDYHVVAGTTTTIAVVRTKSGPIFVGSSACISLEDFDAEQGRQTARKEAMGKLWGALGTARGFVLGGCSLLQDPEVEG